MRRAGLTEPPPWTPLAQFPGVLACAVLVSEDPRFLEHPGVEWWWQKELAKRALTGNGRRGSSGISQQLARNLYLSPRLTPRRKLREYLLAINIGRHVSHARQLELYLNSAQWGPTTWGAAQAARAHLGKSLDSLTVSDATVLVAMLPAPRRGFTYALHPARRSRLERLTQELWLRGVISDAQAGASAARITQWIVAADTGAAVAMGLERVRSLMGDELPWRGPPMPEVGCVRDGRWGR
jgi:membrane peptidoglycan carboxypeptidase